MNRTRFSRYPHLRQQVCGLAALLIASVAVAAQPVAVEELVSQVLAGHPALQMAVAELADALGQRASAGAWRNPELSGDIGAKESRDANGEAKGRGLAFTVSLSQTFEWPGRGALRKAVADRDAVIARIALEQLRRELGARVRGLAADLAALDEKRAIADEAADEGDRIARAILGHPDAGANRTIETRLIEADAIGLRATALELEARASAVRAELNQLRGAEPRAPLRIATRDRAPGGVASPESLLAMGAANHPAVRIRALEHERARVHERQARLGSGPDFAVGPFYAREGAGDVETVVGATVSLPLPLWDRGAGAIVQARARADRTAAALALARREADAEILRLHGEWAAATRFLERVPPARVAAFREATIRAADQFRAGAISARLYLEMRREFYGVAAARLDALASATRAAASLDALTSPPPAPAPEHRRTKP